MDHLKGILLMKKILILFVLVLPFLVPCLAHAETAPRPILFTYYRQLGWGDRIEIGYVDSKGDLWSLDGNDGNLHWPYQAAEQIRYLEERLQKQPADALP